MKYCPLCAHELEEVEIDAKPRLSCSSATCDYIYWNNPTPVIGALVERNGEVVLVRNKGWPEKMFGLVTGFLEEGETADNAILREVSEELPDFWRKVKPLIMLSCERSVRNSVWRVKSLILSAIILSSR
jgi:NADH pyrophosphatase NudC (nudix superfamily)